MPCGRPKSLVLPQACTTTIDWVPYWKDKCWCEVHAGALLLRYFKDCPNTGTACMLLGCKQGLTLLLLGTSRPLPTPISCRSDLADTC